MTSSDYLILNIVDEKYLSFYLNLWRLIGDFVFWDTDSILQQDNVKTLQNTHITQYLQPLPFKKINNKINLFKCITENKIFFFFPERLFFKNLNIQWSKMLFTHEWEAKTQGKTNYCLLMDREWNTWAITGVIFVRIKLMQLSLFALNAVKEKQVRF